MFCARCGEQIPDASEICPLCGREATVKLPPAAVFQIVPAAQVGFQSQVDASKGPNGVGGWLLFFCIVLTVLGPLSLIIEIMLLKFARNPVRAINLVRLAYGVVVGIFLWRRQPVALSLLRIYFVLVAALDVIGVLQLIRDGLSVGWAFVLHSSRVAPLLVALGLIVLWFFYFRKSQRVRNTYGANV